MRSIAEIRNTVVLNGFDAGRKRRILGAVVAKAFVLAVCVLFCICPGHGQTGASAGTIGANAVDLAAYRAFFSDWQRLGSQTHTVQEAIPLTDDETKLLGQMGAVVVKQMALLAARRGAVQQEAVVRTLTESDQPSMIEQWKKQQLAVIDGAERQLWLRAASELRSALGDARFEVLNGHVRSGTLTALARKYTPKRK